MTRSAFVYNRGRMEPKRDSPSSRRGMTRADFRYELPPDLVAQAPLSERSASRLLVLDRAGGAIADRRFADLPDFLGAGDLLVCNDTRVLPARLQGRKPSGGRVELLLERLTGPRMGRFQLRASRSPTTGTRILLAGGVEAEVTARDSDFFVLRFDCELMPFLEKHGAVPLPPYIARAPERDDEMRYQTVFARAPGAVAAPTAGLHFDAGMLSVLSRHGVDQGFLTLHVGAGTFAPVRVERLEEHRLHSEWLSVSPRLCEQIAAARARGGRVTAVGTTTVRALETAALRSGREPLEPFDGETDLFITPGFEFRVVDALITNFHLPESSLLMLVAAFAGHDSVMRAYRHAVQKRYRFFSYGDAMFITALTAGRDDAV